MPKVSIIIPTYNVEAYLRQCMDSVTGQTLTDLEILAVNDGSTDHSLEILKEYEKKDSRIRILDGPNGGYGKAMNRGLNAATGEYIGIVEPDDFILPDMCKDLYQIAVKENLDIIKADFYRFTGENPSNLEKTYVPLSPSGRGYRQVICPAHRLEVFKFVLNTWSGIYKRKFLEDFQIRHNETPGASYQDNGFWFQTFTQAERIMFLDKPYYMNRRDNPNSSVHNREKVYCMNEEYAFIRRFMEQHPDILKTFMGVYHYKQYHNYVFTFQRIDDSFRKEYAKKFALEFKEAYDRQEIDESLFSDKDLYNLSILLEDPLKYYYWQSFNSEMQRLLQENNRLKKEVRYVEKLRKSPVYRPAKALIKTCRKLRRK